MIWLLLLAFVVLTPWPARRRRQQPTLCPLEQVKMLELDHDWARRVAEVENDRQEGGRQ